MHKFCSIFEGDGDRQQLAQACLSCLNVKLTAGKKSAFFPISPQELSIVPFAVRVIEIGWFSAETKHNFYASISSKPAAKKLAKDDSVAELLLQLASKESEFSYEQRIVLVSMATSFRQETIPFLKHFVSLLICAFLFNQKKMLSFQLWN